MASTCICNFSLHVLLFVLILASSSESCYGQRTIGFDVHHRFSDAIRKNFPLDNLPEKGSLDYYRVLAHQDRIIHARRLAGTSTTLDQILTFSDGNTTYQMGDYWGYLHYASVSLGTPSISFFVALDTGSDVFWVPCDCPTCTSIPLTLDNGAVVNINYYSPKASSTSKYVPCNSSLCEQQYQCPDPNQNTCPYQVIYADQSSTSGYLVEDFLHLKTDDSHRKDVDARITFGCSQFQTGSFGATDGLFGLGWDKLSVPSILSSAGLTANSFSMCFGSDGIGRINFGDKGSPDQLETSFILDKSNLMHRSKTDVIHMIPTVLLNIVMTQVQLLQAQQYPH